MPCRDYYPEELHAQTQKRLDEVTALLCKVCKIIQPSHHWNQMPSDIVNWYQAHIKEDDKRQREEILNKIRAIDFLDREIESLKKQKKALEDK